MMRIIVTMMGYIANKKQCKECGYRHGKGRCCIDIYQQLGQAKGPSVVGKVILAFLLPILIFIGTLILIDMLLASVMANGALKILLEFLGALAVTALCVQLIRILTRKSV